MAGHDIHDEIDAAFDQLFAALDGVKASDELKASTLEAILAAAEDEESQQPDDTVMRTAATQKTSEDKKGNRGLVVIEGGMGGNAEPSATGGFREVPAKQTATDGSEVSSDTVMLPGSTLVAPRIEVASIEDTMAGPVIADGEFPGQLQANGADSRVSAGARKKAGSWRLKVAAVLVVLALVVGGGAAYALPATHVYATAGDTTFDLGVNVFGITVSAEADSADGKEILKEVDVRNASFVNAFDRILRAYEERGGEESPSIRIESNVPFGGADRLGEQANNVMRSREQRRADQAQSGGSEVYVDYGGDPGRPQDFEPSAPAQDAPMGQDGGERRETEAAPAERPNQEREAESFDQGQPSSGFERGEGPEQHGAGEPSHDGGSPEAPPDGGELQGQ